ncbi:MAG: PilZ domain-containing protein [Oscillospiraceae bacterium]|nr:PilZ domain-containing protein [Oscillospiraceae bacterium]
MLFSNKIRKIEILDTNGTVVVAAEKGFVFPKNLNSDEDSILIIKGRNLAELERDARVYAVVSTKAGERIRYNGCVTISMDTQLNVKVFAFDDTKVLKERRRYFKIRVEEEGRALFFVRGEDTVRFDVPEPIEIQDINIGGIFMSSGYQFDSDDAVCVEIDLFKDYRLNAMAHVLRVQRDRDGNVTGYGCEFIGLTAAQEDYIGKYIYAVQSSMRQKDIASDMED